MEQLQFWGFTPYLHDLFYGLSPEDKPCYSLSTGKIDGIPVVLEFVATESFLTVMVSYASARPDMGPFELTIETHDVMQAMNIARRTDWSDTNSEYLKNECGFDLILTGQFTRQESINRNPLDNIQAEVVWLDTDDGCIVELGETINLALNEINGMQLFYDFTYNNRQCLVIANSRGLTNIQLRKLVERWIRAGGVV